MCVNKHVLRAQLYAHSCVSDMPNDTHITHSNVSDMYKYRHVVVHSRVSDMPKYAYSTHCHVPVSVMRKYVRAL